MATKLKIDWTKPIEHMKGPAEYLGELGTGRFKHFVKLRTGVYQYDDFGIAMTTQGNRPMRTVFNVDPVEHKPKKDANGTSGNPVLARQLKLLDTKLSAIMSNLGITLPAKDAADGE